MSIISKQSWDKFTQEEKEKLRELYSNSVKVDFGVMRKIFPEEALQPQPLTYDDVARELFKDGAWQFRTSYFIEGDSNADFIKYASLTLPLNLSSEKQAEKLLAINKLLNVAKFLNGDWKPDWEGLSEAKCKWYIMIDLNGNINVSSLLYTNNAPVYFRTEELARKAVTILGEQTVRLALGDY